MARKNKIFSVCQEVRQQLQLEKGNLDYIIKGKENNLNNLVVVDKHRLLYCYVPKVASTNGLNFLVI